MKASELRIGNYLQTIDGFTFQWESENFDDNLRFKGDVEIVEDSIIPIPLIEEWLLRFGFEKNDFYEEELSYNFNDVIPYSSYYPNIKLIVNADWESGIKLEFVHQLQNLYFALTGEELKIKE